MKKIKLYVKNDKGKYEEYKPERKTDDGNLLFRKVNGKYVPCGRSERYEMIGEGVWVVLSNLSMCSKQCISGDYLKELFQIQKVSGIEDVTISQLGGLERYCDYVMSEFIKNEKHFRGLSGFIHFIIGKVFEFNSKQQMKNNGGKK